MLGILVADKAELARLQLPSASTKIGQFQAYEYAIDQHQVILLVTGIGPVNAAAATQALIMLRPITHLYNFGSAGGYDLALTIGTLVLPREVYFHDVTTPWYPRGQMPGEAARYLTVTPPALSAAYASFNLATGSSFLTDSALAMQLATTWNACVYDMEAAAVAQVAYQHHLPLTIVKCVSDLIGVNASLDQAAINKRLAMSGAKAYDLIEKIIGLYAF